MTIYDTIATAIRDHKPVKAKYRGDRGAIRQFCPHVLGLTSGGTTVVLCYQFAGYSARTIEPVGSKKNWRCLKLNKLTNVQGMSGALRTATNYSVVKQKNIKTVHKKI